MAAKIIAPKKPRGVRKEMECNAFRDYPGRKGCGARFSYVPSDCRDIVLNGNGRQENDGPRFKVPPVERYVRCPKCRHLCFLEVVRPGVKYSRRELDIMEAQADVYGRGQGGH